MRCRITKTVTFDAAHRLPMVADGHKCGCLHGHTYKVVIGLEGEIDTEMGWVQDYGEVAVVLNPIIEKLDHACLNEIKGLEKATSEILAVWIFNQLRNKLPLLTDVAVSETASTEAIYRP